MAWYSKYLNNVVLDVESSFSRAEFMPDPRVTMYSCYDHGGAENGDDWMYQLVGGGWKYSPIGLDFSRSVMGGTTRKGTLLFNVRIDGQTQPQWGCLECAYAAVDRVVMTGPYWGREDVGFVIEFLRSDSGSCIVSMAVVNRGNKHLTVEVAESLVDVSNKSTRLHNHSVVEQDGFFVAYLLLTDATGEIPPGETYEYVCVFSLAATKNKCSERLAAATQCELPAFRVKQEKLANPEFLEQFNLGENRQLAHAIFNVMRQNLLADGDECFSAPNRIIHKGQWLWDTCFHAIAWKLFDPQFAQKLLLNIFRYQDKQTGFIPINADATHGVINYATQPPLIAMALREVCDDTEVLSDVYPKLAKFYDWFEVNRMLPNGLYHWNTAGESGMDNSPRFDDDPTLPTTPEKLNFCNREITPNIAHIDISCMMVNFAEAMSEFALKIGNIDDFKKWQKKAGNLKILINEILYCEDGGFYYDRKTDGQWLKVKTVATFWALYAGVCDKSQAETIMQHIMNPKEFFTEFPLPSVAIDEPSFCMNYWRGPVWINTDYITVEGLRKYGYFEQAAQITGKVRKGILREYYRTGHFWELYDSLGGPSEAAHKKHQGPRQNASEFCGWTANVLNML